MAHKQSNSRNKRENMNALAEWVARAFDLPRPPSSQSVTRILQNEAILLKVSKVNYDRKKPVDPVEEEVDRALLQEFDRMAVELPSLNDHALIYHAKLFAAAHFKQLPTNKLPSFSKGWVYRFRKRPGIYSIRKHGEVASVSASNVVDGHVDMRKLTNMYPLQDIYNRDETSFFYRADCSRTLSSNRKVAGVKADKTRVTMAVATNADGSDKLPLLFIGKAENPRAFKNHNVVEEFGVEYTNSKKARMNGGIFKDWLRTLDLRMGLEKRRILLLVDNVSSHMRPPVALWNVRLEFLPKNTTSMLQPLDQGIIACVKRSFSRIKVEDSIDRYVAGLPQQIISIRTAMDWASRAWNDVTPTIIGNCWVHSSIIPRPDAPMSMRQILCF